MGETDEMNYLDLTRLRERLTEQLVSASHTLAGLDPTVMTGLCGPVAKYTGEIAAQLQEVNGRIRLKENRGEHLLPSPPGPARAQS